MVRSRSTIFLVGVSLAVGIISTFAIAQSKNTKATATRAHQLLRAMDKEERHGLETRVFGFYVPDFRPSRCQKRRPVERRGIATLD